MAEAHPHIRLIPDRLQSRSSRLLKSWESLLVVVALAYLEGLSHSEIAGRLGMPLGTVKSRMRMAYQKIRMVLEDVE